MRQTHNLLMYDNARLNLDMPINSSHISTVTQSNPPAMNYPNMQMTAPHWPNEKLNNSGMPRRVGGGPLIPQTSY